MVPPRNGPQELGDGENIGLLAAIVSRVVTQRVGVVGEITSIHDPEEREETGSVEDDHDGIFQG